MACGRILEFPTRSCRLNACVGSRWGEIAVECCWYWCWRWSRRSWRWRCFAYSSARRLVLIFPRAGDTLVRTRWCESAAESLWCGSWCDAGLLTRNTGSWPGKFSCVLESAHTLACDTVEAHTTPLISLTLFCDTTIADRVSVEPRMAASFAHITSCELVEG
jgi:hypothetical protein